MERVSSMFSNAFATKAGQLVEKATASNLTAENWGLNMEICDCVNSYDDGPKDAVKAVKRRLANNKNQNQISFTLTVLEACVKNCGSRLHILVTSREFCNDVMVKLIHPKNSPSLVLQQKVLGMIQEWADTFKNNPAMNGVVEVYEELKQKGWEFPKQDKTAAAPIITPKRSVPQQAPVLQPAQFQPMPQYYAGAPGMPVMPVQGGVMPQQAAQPPRIPPGAQPTTGPITPSQEQILKLRSELQIVLGNVHVMSEMLTELVPGQTEPADVELIQELNRTCRAMQQRVVELVGRVSNEELTVELLKVNDDLNNVFLRYERFERYRASQPAAKATPQQTNPTPAPITTQAPAPAFLHSHTEPPPSYSDTETPTAEVNDLIDLGNDETVPVTTTSVPPTDVSSASNDLASLSLDQLMTTPLHPASYPSLSQDLAQFDKSEASEPTVAEMSQAENEIEQWLQAGEADELNQASAIDGASQGDAQAVTTDEFNSFLNERAKAGEQLPTLPDVPTHQVNQTNGADGRQRKMQGSSQPMFGL